MKTITADTYNIEYILVQQKDAILFLINQGKLVEAQAALDVLTPLWMVADYDYKVHELRKRINDYPYTFQHEE